MNRLDELVEEYSLSSYHYRWSMPVIFLSGAMTGLSELEQKNWREYFKDHFKSEYYIIDPTVLMQKMKIKRHKSWDMYMIYAE